MRGNICAGNYVPGMGKFSNVFWAYGAWKQDLSSLKVKTQLPKRPWFVIIVDGVTRSQKDGVEDSERS